MTCELAKRLRSYSELSIGSFEGTVDLDNLDRNISHFAVPAQARMLSFTFSKNTQEDDDIYIY